MAARRQEYTNEGDCRVVLKIVAVVSLLALPLSALLWRASYRDPQYRRYDVTLYKSLQVLLKDGVCGLHLLNMPTKTASRTEFLTPVKISMTPGNRSLLLSSKIRGKYRVTWVVFPLWLSTTALAFTGTVPLATTPIRQWRRKRNGWCLECAYDLTGNRSGRCPECGTRFRRPVRRIRRSHL